MRIRKILIIALLPLILECIISCCDCEEIPYINYNDLSSYSHAAMLISNLDNSGPTPLLVENDTVPCCAYAIRVVVDRQEKALDDQDMYSLAHPSKTKNLLTPIQHQGLMQSAYAFSCHCPEERIFIPADSLLSVHVYCLDDFDSSHPAGSDISSYFRIYRNEYMMVLADAHYLSNYELNSLDDEVLEFNLLLMEAPSSEGPQQFRVEINLSDGRVLEERTDAIVLSI